MDRRRRSTFPALLEDSAMAWRHALPLLLFLLPSPSPGSEPPPGCPVPFEVKTAPHKQVLLVPHEQATAVPAWKIRDIEAGRCPGGPVLEFEEQRQVVTEMKLESREVEQQVVCVESKPETVVDPCTGHATTVYRPCEVVRTVKVKVYETVPVQREVVVRVPVLKPGPEVIVKRAQLDPATEAAIVRRFSAVTTPSPIPVVAPVPKVAVPGCVGAPIKEVPPVKVPPCVGAPGH